jgi:hypothetical protein
MIVGIDLDNTIIDYSNIFYKIGKQKKIKIKRSTSKNNLKTFIQSASKKEWTRIQGEVYGKKIMGANLFKNFTNFLKFAFENNIQLVIISHKTKKPIIGKKNDLHKAAQNFLIKKIGKNVFKLNKNLFFEEKLEDKIKKIKEYDCDYFIDDLEKVLLDKKFPTTTEKILFNSTNKNINNFNNWHKIIKFFREQIKINSAHQGRNNKSFKIMNNEIFVKEFNSSKKNESFSKELKFSQFLNDNKNKYTPKILSISKRRKVIKYEYKENNNKKEHLKNIHKTIIDNFRFIKEINNLDYKNKKFNFATGYCEKLKNYKNEIEKRIYNLKKTFFYKNNLKFRTLIKKIEYKLNLLFDINYFEKKFDLDKKSLILSPCDFHFENMIFNKKIYYIDFEYSGIDDPAKLYSIFYLQPEFNINLNIFFKTINKVLFFKRSNNAIKRNIIFLMPIIYLRWSLILLNQFLSKDSKTKTASDYVKPNFKNKNTQLIKANNYLKDKNQYFKLYKKFI